MDIKKIIIIGVIVVIVGYFGYSMVLRSSMQKKLGDKSPGVKSDLDKLTLIELMHLNKVIDLYLEIKDRPEAELMANMATLTKMKELCKSPTMNSILKKTGNLKNFGTTLQGDFITQMIAK